jgi:hypothetical protein
MYRYILAAGVVSLLFASCGKKEARQEEKRKAITFELKNYKLYSDNCGGDTAKCASYEVSYPEFTGIDSAVSKAIRYKIDSVLSIGFSEGMVQSFEQNGRLFIDQYQDFTAEDPEAAGAAWYYSANVNVENSVDSLITLSIYTEDYSGGAHPNAATIFLNIDAQTGSRVQLDNVLKPGYKNALTKIGERVFREQRQLADTVSFKNNAFDFPDGKFQLNKNYGFTSEGILFYYNSYEVASYAAGPTEVLIPYTEIKDWLK